MFGQSVEQRQQNFGEPTEMDAMSTDWADWTNVDGFGAGFQRNETRATVHVTDRKTPFDRSQPRSQSVGFRRKEIEFDSTPVETKLPWHKRAVNKVKKVFAGKTTYNVARGPATKNTAHVLNKDVEVTEDRRSSIESMDIRTELPAKGFNEFTSLITRAEVNGVPTVSDFEDCPQNLGALAPPPSKNQTCQQTSPGSTGALTNPARSTGSSKHATPQKRCHNDNTESAPFQSPLKKPKTFDPIDTLCPKQESKPPKRNSMDKAKGKGKESKSRINGLFEGGPSSPSNTATRASGKH